MSERKKRITYLCTHGPEDAEKATLPFAMAIGAQAMDMDVVVILQSAAVGIAVKGVAEHIFAGGMAPLKDQMDEYLGNGGEIVVCSACLTARKLESGHLLAEVKVVSVSWLNSEFSASNNVVCY